MTRVIDIIGGSGLGKSTTACGLFYHMKLKSYHCEIVTEFVKRLAWQGRKITALDQLYITGQQTQSENILYGKVDWIITDSPVLLSGIYDSYYNKRNSVAHTVLDFLNESKIKHHYYLLQRTKPFDDRGRYETEEQAKEIDSFTKQKLLEWNIPFTEVICKDEDRVNYIMENLSL